MSDGHHQRRSNGETIRTTSPDLKQFFEQIKGKRIETKRERAVKRLNKCRTLAPSAVKADREFIEFCNADCNYG